VLPTLRRHLPVLLPGLGAHAYHPIIRTAYGVRFDDPAEVAMGLAYWGATFLPLGPLAPTAAVSGATSDPAAALAFVRSQPLLTADGRRKAGITKPDGLNIAGNMRWNSTLEGFGKAVSALTITDASLPAIAHAVVRLYLGTGDDFTALHAVTGTHAYRVLEPFVADPIAGRRHLWQSLVAAYASIGAPPIAPAAPARALPPWTDVVARAAASSDDHEIKLCDVARQEALHYGDGAYLQAAAQHLGLV
jgi:hypothetical protein